MQPLVTLYRPKLEGNRWIARADVSAGGETVELTATASDKLAKRAASWYNQAAEYISQWVQFADEAPERLGVGAFGDLPIVAHEVGSTLASIPQAPPAFEQATDLAISAATNPQAQLRLSELESLAGAGDKEAAATYHAACLLGQACNGAWPLWQGAVIGGTMSGDITSAGMYRAMRRLGPIEPARVRYSADDYARCGCQAGELSRDVIGATLVELSSPMRAPLHVVRPYQYRAAIDAFRSMAAHHGAGEY